MNFQQPQFLWALFLLLIPILIHLFNFRRYKKVYFSNVEMLKKVQAESRKTRQLKRYLVLLTRMLAIAALVIAFALPFIPNDVVSKGRNLVSIYLDNSYSMLSEGENGQLFENGKNIAREILKSLPKESEVQVIDNAQSPFVRKLMSVEEAEKIIDDLDLTAHNNTIERVSESSQFVSQTNGFASSQLYLISDFQKQGDKWTAAEDSSVSVYTLATQPSEKQNISIDSVWLYAPISKPNEPVQLSVAVKNNGSAKVPSTTLELKINGVQQGIESFELNPKERKVLPISYSSGATGWINGEVLINDVPLTFDNRYFFTLQQKTKISVLQIGKSSSTISKVYANDPSFGFRSLSPTQVDYNSLVSYDLVILNEMSEITSGLAEQLKKATDQGVNLVIIPSAQKNDYQALQTTFSLPKYGKLQQKILSISSENLNHPFIRDVYKTRPKNILMPKVSQLLSLTGGAPIFSLKDGSSVLVSSKRGNGVIYQWAFPLSNKYSGLPESELLVNSFLKMAFTSSNKQALAYPLHYSNPIELRVNESVESSIELSKGNQSVLVESSNIAGNVRYWLNEELSDEGIYSVKTNGGEDLARVALNHSRFESKQEFNSDKELESIFSLVNHTSLQTNAASIKQSAAEAGGGKPLWKFFLLLCLIFLLIEVLLLRFLKS